VSFRLAQTIRHATYAGTTRDPRGNVTDSWADYVDAKVYGWVVGGSHEPKIAGHDRVVVDAEVFGPESWRTGSRDRVELPGFGAFEVIGDQEDYNHGPFGWRPGLVTNLRRVEG